MREETCTGLINQQLYSWVHCNRLLPDSQYGLRRGYLTISVATNLKTTIENGISSIGRYFVCFIDFAKAFDTVDRTKLMSKLCEFGIDGNSLRSNKCCVTKNLFCILDSGVISDTLQTYTALGCTGKPYLLKAQHSAFNISDSTTIPLTVQNWQITSLVPDSTNKHSTDKQQNFRVPDSTKSSKKLACAL